MRGVSLDEVSVATRISPRYLEALESEQWQSLPGTAFNRGFIRTISRYLAWMRTACSPSMPWPPKTIPSLRRAKSEPFTFLLAGLAP